MSEATIIVLAFLAAITVGTLGIVAIVFNLAPQLIVRATELIFTTVHRPPPELGREDPPPKLAIPANDELAPAKERPHLTVDSQAQEPVASR